MAAVCKALSAISIHALLAESDVFLLRKITITVDISIHALLAESDYIMTTTICIALKFLSTLSLRRATAPPYNLMIQHTHFYPRSPCGERLITIRFLLRLPKFLSTLSLRRATSLQRNQAFQPLPFLSTLSLRRATTLAVLAILQHCRFLSTLSLRRATTLHLVVFGSDCNFYPRSPCGERLIRSAGR